VALSVQTARIVDTKVFFQLPAGARLTEGATYKLSVPAGLFVDAFGNANAAFSKDFGTVLSGSFSANDYMGDNVTLVTNIGNSSATDNYKPTFVSMYPAHQAVDVPAIPGVAILIYFSEPVKFNASGIITFKNSSNANVGTLNLTSDRSKLALVPNGVRLRLPSQPSGKLLLKKGDVFQVSLPNGVILDASGNQMDALAKSFTCLAEAPDTTPPIMTMANPPVMTQSISGSPSRIDLYFSEPIEAGLGNVTIASPSQDSSRCAQIHIPVPSSNVTISGAIMSIRINASLLSTQCQYSVQLPPGILRETAKVGMASANPYMGLNGTSLFFDTVPADVVAPTFTIASQLIPQELIPTYGLPRSATMVLSFNENIQSGPGAIVLRPEYKSPTLIIPASQTTIIGNQLYAIPGQGLMPGEVYRVTIEATAFKDLQSNFYVGLQSGYTISTAAFIDFNKAGSQHWGNQNYFDGSRYKSGVTVDAQNNIYVIGGHNATSGAGANAFLNDVWKVDTRREIRCASSDMPPEECKATSTCTLNAAGAPILGTTNLIRTVWRVPSAGGAKCIGASGTTKSILGQVVSTSGSVDCPCPFCTTPPNMSLPTHMVNNSYVASYTLVSAALGTVPLLCQSGKVPTGDFTCIVESLYKGKFQTPYPTCVAAPCTSIPSTGSIANFGEFDVSSSSRNLNCTNLNGAQIMNDTEHCAFRCAAGYTSRVDGQLGKLVCRDGNFSKASSGPACLRQSCARPIVTGNSVGVECNTAFLDGECSLRCAPGFALTPVASGLKARCSVTSLAPEASPAFIIPSAARCENSTATAEPATTGAPITRSTTLPVSPNAPITSRVTGTLALTATFDKPLPATSYDSPVRRTLAESCGISPDSFVSVTCQWTNGSNSTARNGSNSTARRFQRLQESQSQRSKDSRMARRLTALAPSLLADYIISVPDGANFTASSVSAIVDAIGTVGSPEFEAFRLALMSRVLAELNISMNLTGVQATATITSLGGSTTPPANTANTPEESSIDGVAVAGGILGSLFLIALIGACTFFFFKNRHGGKSLLYQTRVDVSPAPAGDDP